MNKEDLQRFVYLSTGVIFVDKLLEAKKNRSAFKLLVAGGIGAGLLVQIIEDRRKRSMTPQAAIETAAMSECSGGRWHVPVNPVESFIPWDSINAALSQTTQAPAQTATNSLTGFLKGTGTYLLDVAKSAGGTALNRLIEKELAPDAPDQVTQYLIQSAPEQPQQRQPQQVVEDVRRRASGFLDDMDPTKMALIAGGGVVVLMLVTKAAVKLGKLALIGGAVGAGVYFVTKK